MQTTESPRPYGLTTPWRIASVVLGFPLGVFGTICVAIIAIATSLWLMHLPTQMLGITFGPAPPQNGVGSSANIVVGGLFAGAYMGIYGGFFVGLFTGGPVFAIVAVFRPVILAWFWIFGLCAIASLIGLVVGLLWEFSQGNPFTYMPMLWPYSLVVYPAIMLVLAAPIYMLCTRHQSYYRRPDGESGFRVPRRIYCKDCGYCAQSHQPAGVCAACGRTLGA